MKHTLSLFFLSLLIFTSCKKQNDWVVYPPQSARTSDQITLIFKNPQPNFKYKIGGKRPVTSTYASQGMELETINRLNMTERHQINFDSKIDTVIIKTERESLEFKLTYKGIDELTYHFQNGDSVLIDYNGITPTATILNRPEPSNLTNIQLILRDSILNSEFTPLLEFTNGGLSSMRWVMNGDMTIDIGEFVDNYKLQQSELIQDQYESILKILEKEAVNYELSREHKTAIILDFYWSLRKGTQNSRVQKDIEKFTGLKSLIKQIESDYPFVLKRSDTLLSSINYQRYLYQQPFIAYDIETLEQKAQGYGARTNNYLSAYDSIRFSNNFSENEKLILQYRNVDKLFENSSFFKIEDRLIYLTRFKNDFQDTALFNQLVEKYDVKFEIDDSLELEDENGNKTTLSELVASKKGSLIYLDFWASWCGPCIREIPSSKSLKAKVQDQKIEMIYLSTDRREKPWKQAMNKHDFGGKNHYRITNADNSLAMNELEVIFIPRYMIFDKNGQLVNNDAPRPSEQDRLMSELSKYLEEE